jgi:radical SAM superfamily enzyme YgiQ (UPF0313 family)/glycosyltransferase involved in cell wall biosynthesis
MIKAGISIIIPTLNEEKHIGSILNCLAKQTYKEFETIIVDASSDKTKDKVMEYKEKLNLKIITSGIKNVAHQRNLGVKNAKYNRLLFLDADVEIENNFLEQSIKKENLNTIMIPQYLPRTKDIKYMIFFKAINNLFALFSKLKPCGLGMCIFSSKAIHQKINGFDEKLSWTDDADYVKRGSKYGRYEILKSKVFCSVRRFENEGTKKTMWKWLKAYCYFMTNKQKLSNDIPYFISEKRYRLTLVQPKFENVSVNKLPPLSLLQIASLTPKKYDIEVIDENVEKFKIKETDLVGISVHTTSTRRAYEIANEYQKIGVPVILGGIHVSLNPKEAMRHCSSVVIGEADYIWPKILTDFEKNKLNKVYSVSEKPELRNLPLLKRDLIKDKKYFIKNLIQTSRGCPFSCDFCCVHVFNGRLMRKYPIEHVIKEIKEIKKGKGALRNIILFTDDNIIGDEEYARKMFNRITALNIKWGAQASIDIAKKEDLLDLAYKSGCRALYIGLESVNQSGLNEQNKKNDVDKYNILIKKIQDKGIILECSFILGLDSDKKECFTKTLEFCEKNNIDLASFHPLLPFPGTKLFDKLKEENRILVKDNRYLFVPKHFTYDELITNVSKMYKKYYSWKNILKRVLLSVKRKNSIKYIISLLILSIMKRKECYKI